MTSMQFSSLADGGVRKDAEIKAWAAKMQPTIEEHLKEVQGLSRAAVGTTGTKPTAARPATPAKPGTEKPAPPARPTPTDQPPTRP